MLALPPNTAAGKLWFNGLPVRTRQIIVVVAAGISVFLLLSIVGSWYHHSQPAYVLEVLDRVNSPADVQQENEYFTQQGKDVVLWLQQKAGDKPSSGARAVYSAPVISGNVCDIRFQAGEVVGSMRLLKVDHWRLNDVYFDKAGDKSIGLWASHMKDHPFASWWSIHGDEMFSAFCKGVLFGASVAR